MDKRKAKAEATKKSIVSAAEKLFVKKGFAATSISEIANKAKVTKSLIHHHFGSKEAVWSAVTQQYQDQIEKYLEETVGISNAQWGVDFFEKSLPGYFDWVRDHRNIFRMQAWLCAEGSKPETDKAPRMEEIIAGVEQAQKDGLIRDDIPAVYVLLPIYTMIEAWGTMRHILGRRIGVDLSSNEADRTYEQAIIEIFLRGVQPKSD